MSGTDAVVFLTAVAAAYCWGKCSAIAAHEREKRLDAVGRPPAIPEKLVGDPRATAQPNEPNTAADLHALREARLKRKGQSDA
jgi:hypothetical protein